MMPWPLAGRSLRRGEPLPRSVLPLILTVGIVVVGALAVVIAALGNP